jgi:hypothetical protein
MENISDDQLVRFIVRGFSPEDIRQYYRFTDDQLIRALLRNPMALQAVQKQGRETSRALTQFNPAQRYGTGSLPFEAVVNPTEQKYEGLGLISKEYFDAISKAAGDQAKIDTINEKYLDSTWLQDNYGKVVDTSGMIADVPNFLEDEIKRKTAADKANYDAFLKTAKDSGLLDNPSLSPLQNYFQQQFGTAGLGSVPDVEATWAEALGAKGKRVKYSAPKEDERNRLVADYAQRERDRIWQEIKDKMEYAKNYGGNPDDVLKEYGGGPGTGVDPTKVAQFYASREMESILDEYAKSLGQASARETDLAKQSQSNINRYMNYLLGGTTPYVAASQRILSQLQNPLGN